MYVSEIVQSKSGALAGVHGTSYLSGGLGFSIGKSLKRVVSKHVTVVKSVAKKTGTVVKKGAKQVGSFVKRQWKKDMGRLKKVIGKYGTWIALAAQILNFIPGLGIAVGLAISSAAAAITAASTVINMKAAAKAAGKAEDQATIEAAKMAQQEAEAAQDEAYLKGEQYFSEKYQMTADKWQKLTYEQKARFLNEVVFDQHAALFEESGVTKDAFTKLTIEQQQDMIAKLGAAFEEEGAKLPWEEEFLGLPILAWLGIGGAIAIAIPLISFLKKPKTAEAA